MSRSIALSVSFGRFTFSVATTESNIRLKMRRVRSALRRRAVVLSAVALATVAGLVLAARFTTSVTEPEEALRADEPVAVPPLDAPVVFRAAVVGDFGTGGTAERAVAAQVRRWAQSRRADALVTTGDNVYPAGEPDEFARAWRRPYGWVAAAGLRVVASLGNHDVGRAGGRPVMGLLGMPARWYATRVGNADLFVLDGNDPTNPKQLAWLRSALAGSQARWQIAVFHQPAYSCSRHDSTPTIVRNWVPVFEAYGVDLVLNGHDHNYQRFASRNGVTYVVAGGGGKGLYEIDECGGGEPAMAAGNDEDHSFVTVEASDGHLRLTAIGATGEILDAAIVGGDN